MIAGLRISISLPNFTTLSPSNFGLIDLPLPTLFSKWEEQDAALFRCLRPPSVGSSGTSRPARPLNLAFSARHSHPSELPSCATKQHPLHCHRSLLFRCQNPSLCCTSHDCSHQFWLRLCFYSVANNKNLSLAFRSNDRVS